ncbi:hypothetical protein [Pseudomonas sp. GL-RE-20]|uniref:hypothetical protein n=1 Tax=Pseudomonas sp. GL-RE-20 TaxID=2832372 RepID=UPI001CC03EB6|nr:hypothetical protein [Pseudomonas sp. GL-RE-20]
MSYENEDLSESLAAELTGSTGMTDSGQDMPNDVADAVEEQERYLAEKDIPLSNDVDDTRQGELDREAEQEQAQQRGRKVPLAALHEERQKRQALELQLQAQAQQLQQFMAQQQAAQQAQLQAQQEAALPEFSEDPETWVKMKAQQLEQALAQVQNQGQQPQQQQDEAHFQAQFEYDRATVLPIAIQMESEFVAATPDYPAAFDFVQNSVESQLRAQYPQATEQQFGVLRTVALVGFNKRCLANGINPAAHIYQRAQAMGFKGASRAAPKTPPTSLSNAHGSSRAPDERGQVSASQISDMSEAEFDKYWNDMKRSSTVGPKY